MSDEGLVVAVIPGPQPEVVLPLPPGLTMATFEEVERRLGRWRCEKCGLVIEKVLLVGKNEKPIGLKMRHSFPDGKGALAGIPDHLVEPVNDPDGGDQVSVCDFCGQLGAVWDYPADDVEIPLTGKDTYVSHGGWMACDPCHDDIEADRWDAITERWWSYYRSILDEDASAAEKRGYIRRQRKFAEGFRSVRKGPAVHL